MAFELHCHLESWRQGKMWQCMEPLWQQNSWVHISYTRGLLFSGQSGQACLSGWAEILKSPNGTMPIILLELIERKGIMVPFFCDFTGCSADVLRQDQPNLTSRELQDHGQHNTSGLLMIVSTVHANHVISYSHVAPNLHDFLSSVTIHFHYMGRKDKWGLRGCCSFYHLLLCSTEERWFGTTSRWVNDDRIFRSWHKRENKGFSMQVW